MSSAGLREYDDLVFLRLLEAQARRRRRRLFLTLLVLLGILGIGLWARRARATVRVRPLLARPAADLAIEVLRTRADALLPELEALTLRALAQPPASGRQWAVVLLPALGVTGRIPLARRLAHHLDDFPPRPRARPLQQTAPRGFDAEVASANFVNPGPLVLSLSLP